MLLDYLTSRWTTLTFGLFTEVVAGTSYLFGVYSPQLKAQLGLSQSEINTIGSFMNLGGYICIHAGIVYDTAGPLATLVTAAVLAATGYTIMFLLASGAIAYSEPLMCLAVFLWANGNSFGDTAAVAANVNNFPSDRGLVLGLIKSSYGLSAGVLTIIYSCFFQPDVDSLLRFMAIFLPAALSCVGLAYRVLPPAVAAPAAPLERRKIGCGYLGAIALAVYVSAVGALQHKGTIAEVPLFAYAMLPLVLAPLLQLLPSVLFGCGSAPGGGKDVSGGKALGDGEGGGDSSALLLGADDDSSAAAPLLLVEDVGGEAQHAMAGFASVGTPPTASSWAGQDPSAAGALSSYGSPAAGGSTVGTARPGFSSSGAAAAAAAAGGPPVREWSGHDLSGLLVLDHHEDEDEDGGAPVSPPPRGVWGLASSSAPPPPSPPQQQQSPLTRQGSGGGISLSPASAAALLGSPASPLAGTPASPPQRASERTQHRQLTVRSIGLAVARPVEGAAVVEAVGTLEFALFMLVLYAGTGAGLVMINNLGSLAQSLGAPPDGQDLSVILLSSANCAGRMFFGVMSDATSRRVSRASWLAVGIASMTAAMAVAAFADLGALPAAALLTGFAYGSFWALGPPLLADRFGSRAFGTIYAISALASAAGSYSLSLGLASHVYEANIGPGGGTVCLGAACYRLTFLVLAAMCAAGTAAAAWLSWRLRALYRGKDGRAVPYGAYPPAHGRRGCCVRALQAAFAPLCPCRCGRALLRSEVDEAEAEGGVEREARAREEHAGGVAAAGARGKAGLLLQ